MPNQRISELPERDLLHSRSEYYSDQILNDDNYQQQSNHLFLLTAREKISNQKISFDNFKKSVLDLSVFIKGDQEISGKKTFSDKCSIILGQSIPHKSLEVEKYINDKDSNKGKAFFNDEQIHIESSNSISFTTNYLPFSFSKNGGLNIKKYGSEGSLSVANNSYIENIYTKYKNKIERLPLEDIEDETVFFTEPLQHNTILQKIFFPKTFKYKPIINVNLFQDKSPIFIPFSIKNVNKNSFEIKFGAKIPTKDYSLHITASSPSITEDGKQNPMQETKFIQRFHTQLEGNKKTHEIQFPLPYINTPSVSVCIESEGDIVNQSISSVNNKSFLIHFSDKINNQYIIHTYSQEITQ